MTQVQDSGQQSTENAPSARRDFGLLWAGQSLSLFGDQFMILALPLFAVTVLKVSPAIAVLGNVALYLPFLVLGLPAGAIVEGMRYRSIMMAASALQMVTFGLIWLLAVVHVRSFPLFIALILVGGCGVVFFQVSYTSYVPSLFRKTKDLHKANARLALSESASQSLGPMAAGPLIALLSTAGAIAGNALSFAASLLTLALIRHREEPGTRQPRERGWVFRRVVEGLRFVGGHPMLQPLLLCGTTYALFLSMVETSLVRSRPVPAVDRRGRRRGGGRLPDRQPAVHPAQRPDRSAAGAGGLGGRVGRRDRVDAGLRLYRRPRGRGRPDLREHRALRRRGIVQPDLADTAPDPVAAGAAEPGQCRPALLHVGGRRPRQRFRFGVNRAGRAQWRAVDRRHRHRAVPAAATAPWRACRGIPNPIEQRPIKTASDKDSVR
jgi:hypothetical protein